MGSPYRVETRDPFLESYEWRTVRMRVLERDGARCSCCGATGRDGAVMNVDHIKPRRRYPELALTESNLQVLCSACNQGKGNKFETDWRPKPTNPAPSWAAPVIRDVLMFPDMVSILLGCLPERKPWQYDDSDDSNALSSLIAHCLYCRDCNVALDSAAIAGQFLGTTHEALISNGWADAEAMRTLDRQKDRREAEERLREFVKCWWVRAVRIGHRASPPDEIVAMFSAEEAERLRQLVLVRRSSQTQD